MFFLLLLAGSLAFAEDAGPVSTANAKPGNALNVKTTCGAKGNGQGDDSFFIQRCIQRARRGQTVYFPNGKYNLGSTINVKGGITLLGESTNALLHAENMGNWIFMFPNSGANDITINSLTIEGGGINTLGNGEIPNNIRITNCRFQNLTPTAQGWQQQNFIYSDNGLSHSRIDHNSFYMLLGNGSTRIDNNPDYDGDIPRSAIFAWGFSNMSIDHNTFDRVYQGIKACQVFPFKAENVYIGWNVMTHLHRMGIEVQDGPGCGRKMSPGVPINTTNVTIEHNRFTDWDDYFWSSFGISWANSPSENIVIRENVITAPEMYDGPGKPSAHPGIGIEVGGRPVHVYNNTLRGPWGAAIAVFSGSKGGDVHHNFACNVNKNSGRPTIADEGNPDPTDTRYHENTTAYPCPPVQPSPAPVPGRK